MAFDINRFYDTPSRSALRSLPFQGLHRYYSLGWLLAPDCSVTLSGMKQDPGKNALLHCTTAGSTPLRLDHESFVVSCPLALLGSALYPVLVHRLTASIHAASPHSVTLMQLRFTSFAVINLRRDLHPRECTHAGRTKKAATELATAFSIQQSTLCYGASPRHWPGNRSLSAAGRLVVQVHVTLPPLISKAGVR